MKNAINWKIENNIGHLVFNTPPSNSMGRFFFSELHELTSTIIPQSSAQAIVLYGSGRHFSSGADIDSLLRAIKSECTLTDKGDISAYPAFIGANNRSFSFFDSLKIPVIAAIRGVCLGSALELALFCHIRICGDGAIFALPETTFNLIPGCGGIQRIIQCAGLARGLELILNGNNFNAQEALEWGVVHAVVPKKEVIDRALSLAESIVQNYNRIYIPEYIKEHILQENQEITQ